MATLSSTVKKGKLTQKTSATELTALYPVTSADIVEETTSKKIMTSDERTKLSGIASGAQVNILEGVQLNGKDLTITNKKVNIVVDTSDKINVSDKGVANGVATLDSGAKIPLSQIPDAVLGQMTFGGILSVTNNGVSHIEVSANAISLGIPASSSASAIDDLYRANPTRFAGLYFIVSESITNATLTFGSAQINNVTTGDWIVLLGTYTSTAAPYGKVDNTDAVTSVAGRTGAVTLTKSDVGLGNVTNESKATMFASAALTGTPTAPTADAGTNNTQIATTAFVQTAVTNGTADKAKKLETARTISATGDISWSVSFDGSANKSGTATLANSGVTAGTYSAVTVDAKGRVTNGAQFIKVIDSITADISDVATGGLVFVAQ
jgi:hypothetical protein